MLCTHAVTPTFTPYRLSTHSLSSSPTFLSPPTFPSSSPTISVYITHRHAATQWLHAATGTSTTQDALHVLLKEGCHAAAHDDDNNNNNEQHSYNTHNTKQHSTHDSTQEHSYNKQNIKQHSTHDATHQCIANSHAPIANDTPVLSNSGEGGVGVMDTAAVMVMHMCELVDVLHDAEVCVCVTWCVCVLHGVCVTWCVCYMVCVCVCFVMCA